MNNKEKQIEEMAKVICQECLTATEEENCQNEVKDCMAYEYAKLFYNAGYKQPIKDDEVVLNKDELAELTVQMSLNSKKWLKFAKKQQERFCRRLNNEYMTEKLRQKEFCDISSLTSLRKNTVLRWSDDGKTTKN